MFTIIINNITELNGALRNGLQALGQNSTKVELKNTRLCNGSVDIDTHLSTCYPNDNRWDYIIGYDNKAYFIEVHPAHTCEVQVVIRKLEWLIRWLRTKAPELRKISAGYHWVATNGMHILKDSKEARLLAKHGISLPKNRLNVG